MRESNSVNSTSATTDNLVQLEEAFDIVGPFSKGQVILICTPFMIASFLTWRNWCIWCVCCGEKNSLIHFCFMALDAVKGLLSAV